MDFSHLTFLKENTTESVVFEDSRSEYRLELSFNTESLKRNWVGKWAVWFNGDFSSFKTRAAVLNHCNRLIKKYHLQERPNDE